MPSTFPIWDSMREGTQFMHRCDTATNGSQYFSNHFQQIY
ncbi:hypothetical protein DICVIV_08477 [Dictyocaulus viviparus]|uniref:Uncharacterized protein n=1 Tax=Dictyocaulus viviparus TaxID=29172 RepID=A0A0D8XNU4_DICVI|nr:hypothetical protein DICVIV_08477 [Dictyocaulus viviparus]